MNWLRRLFLRKSHYVRVVEELRRERMEECAESRAIKVAIAKANRSLWRVVK